MTGLEYYNLGLKTAEEKDAFKRNIELVDDYRIDHYLNKEFDNFYEFIGGAFTWDGTPEGAYYWREISLREVSEIKYHMTKFRFV